MPLGPQVEMPVTHQSRPRWAVPTALCNTDSVLRRLPLLPTALLFGSALLAAVAIGFTPKTEAPASAATLPEAPSATVTPEVLFVPEQKSFPIANPPRLAVPALSDQELDRALKEHVRDLGSISIGQAHRGQLFNGVHFPEGPLWDLKVAEAAYGTNESVLALQAAIEEVNRMFPNTPRLAIGHLSRENGGWIRPHKSHQSGRDIDVGYYYLGGEQWYVPATAENLDVVRTWALVSAMLKVADVDYLFLDRSLHPLLRAEAERVGESPGLIAEVFDGDASKQPIMRHARGHQTHLHVRFASAVAVRTAQRVGARLGASASRRGALLGVLKQRARVQAKSGNGASGLKTKRGH